MATGLVIFARMGSRRFPGKALAPLAGRPLLGRVLDRARCVGGAHRIVMATSEERSDDPISDFARAEGVDVFRGALEDVAGRALACCDSYGFERFARICADRPFLPWELIDELMELQKAGDFDLATNAQVKSYPSGTMTEVVKTEALRRAIAEGADAADREHVTRRFYARPAGFHTVNKHSGHEDWASISLSIDNPHDLPRAEWILRGLGARPETATLETVLRRVRDYNHEFEGGDCR